MLLFKTIKLPIHIKRNKKQRGIKKINKRKNKGIKKIILAVLATGVLIYGVKELKNYTVVNKEESIFSVEPTAYADEELLDEKRLSNVEKGIKLKKDGTPEILIFHTHSSEEYSGYENGKTPTVIDAGNKLANIISNNYGVGVVHDVSAYNMVNGQISIEGSYERSENGVRELIKKYPDIKILIDLHRDSYNGIEPNTVNYKGKYVSKIMLVNGVCALNNNGQRADAGVKNDYIDQNLAYSVALKHNTDKIAGVMKNIYIKPYRYSLNIMPCSFLLEAGNEKNTIEEVEGALNIFAKALFDTVE